MDPGRQGQPRALEQLSAQLSKAQGQGVERAQAAIDESAKLMKESMTYALQLSNEWHKLSLEMTKKAAGMAGSLGG